MVWDDVHENISYEVINETINNFTKMTTIETEQLK